MRARWLAAALAIVPVSCHLVLGIEEAETIPGSQGAGGNVGSCAIDADCANENPCTEDRCVDNQCVHTPLDGVDAPEQTAGDCRRVVCTAGEGTGIADDGDRPNDDNVCTDDLCNMGTPVHEALEGAPCDDGGQVCNQDGNCVECIDNSYCTMPDTCGGAGAQYQCGCTPTTTCLDEGLTCGSLPNGCGFADCDNDMVDGSETDVDCGGDIPPSGTCNVRCQAGKACTKHLDCASNNCLGDVCQ